MDGMVGNKRKRTKSAEEEYDAAGLLQCLNEQKCLYELHTHLLGMGNASFWVQSILTDQKKLPTQDNFLNSDRLRLQLGPLVWNNEKRTFISREETQRFFDHLREDCDLKVLERHKYSIGLMNLVSIEFFQKLEHRGLSFKKNFSYDIVLSLNNLAKGLGLKEKQPRDLTQAIVEEKLGVYTRSNWQEEHFFNDWIIFNAREQILEIIYGMQAKDLRILIGEAKPINEITDPAQRDARAHIINAFSMMNADGSAPRSVDFHSFRGAFTPEFFPRRFALKDSIYSQRLDLLAFLLRNALYRFSTCSPPIKYCEFSVGCGDLSRPWIFDILLTFSNAEPISELKKLVNNNHFPWLKTDGFERAIDYRFLAGFNRRISRVSHGYSVDEAVAFLFEVPHNAIHVMQREFYRSHNKRPSIIFSEQVKQLQKMEKEARANGKVFFHWVVGLDLFGDELGYPYCPFVADEFLQFLKYAIEENSSFGIRIHCAENVPFVRPELPGYRLFAAHMYIVYRCLDFLKRKLQSNIRVGHGIAFDKLLSIKNYKFRKSSVLVAEMQKNAKSLLSCIPFEVNITSNFYLLGDAIRNVENEKPLSHLYKIKVPIVLSTDDDGIWPIDKCPLEHQEHHSLAAEYCRAITTRFITKNHLKNMIKNSKRFCFTYGKALPKEKSQKTITVRDINEGDYFPTDIIVHPDVLRMLLARIPRSDIDLYPCLKYYQTLYKLKIPPCKSRDFDDDESRDSDDDWKKQCQLIGPVIIACYYVTRSLPYKQFKTEYDKLFKDQRSELVHNACENVYLQLMNDTPGQGARMQVTKDNESFLFCSEVPNNRKGVPNFLLSTIREFITKNTSKATIFSFLPNIDVNNSKVISDLQNIDKSITNRKIEIFIHTNTEKDITIPRMTSGKLLINNKPNQRTGPAQEQIQCALYAVCPHGSVATAALHFIAQHSDNKSLVFERQHVNLCLLVIPFLPLHFGYPNIQKNASEGDRLKSFLECYSISDTQLAKKIQIKYKSILRALYQPKYSLLCADVRYAEQIETKNLIEKIYRDETLFVKILKILCESIRNFNLWPRSFVILENIHEYESYAEKFNSSDTIPVPIIPLENQFLICSSIDFFEKESQTSAKLLWSLAVGWNPPLTSGNNPYEYPYSKWVKSIVKINRQTLNDQFRENTWERFLTIVLFDAAKRAWFWYTVSCWCDVIEKAFSEKDNLKPFVKYLQEKEKDKDFINLLDNKSRHKLGNKWQQEMIRKHKASTYLEKIRKLLDDTS